jgi:hypothetical protein
MQSALWENRNIVRMLVLLAVGHLLGRKEGHPQSLAMVEHWDTVSGLLRQQEVLLFR